MKNETENLIIRIVTTIGIYLWHNASIFIIYLVLNVLDTLTCMLKAKNSRQGLQGVLRKLGCWIINDNLNMYINDHLRMYTSDYALI